MPSPYVVTGRIHVSYSLVFRFTGTSLFFNKNDSLPKAAQLIHINILILLTSMDINILKKIVMDSILHLSLLLFSLLLHVTISFF